MAYAREDRYHDTAHLADGSELMFVQSDGGGKLGVYRAGEHLFNVNFTAPSLLSNIEKKLRAHKIDIEASVADMLSRADVASQNLRNERFDNGVEEPQWLPEYNYPQIIPEPSITTTQLAADLTLVSTLLTAASQLLSIATEKLNAG